MIDEIKKFATITEGKETELTTYLEGLTNVTSEKVEKFLESEDGKKLIQPTLDKYHNKGLETWKTNNLNKLIEEEISKKFPGETDEQKKLRELERDLETEKQARQRESLKNKALAIATHEGLPVALIDHFVGPDEDATIQNLSRFKDVFSEAVKNAVEGKFKEGGRDPHKGKTEPKTQLANLQEQLSKATKLEEKIALRNQIQALENRKE